MRKVISGDLVARMRVSCQQAGGPPIEGREPELLGKLDLTKLESVRRPGVHKNQKHIPGFFWMEQTQDLVWYESRLEMLILKTLDHERNVAAVIAQPFLLSFPDESKVRTHVPDFLLVLKNGPSVLVNVKPKRYVDTPRNAKSFAACQHLANRLNWEYITRSEPVKAYAANVIWLNGYKRYPFALNNFRNELLRRVQQRVSIKIVLQGLEPAALARPALFHLMWSREIDFDSTKILSDETILSPGEVR